MRSITLKPLMIKNYLLPMFLSYPFSLWAALVADDNYCVISTSAKYVAGTPAIPKFALNVPGAKFTQNLGATAYNGGDFTAKLEMDVKPINKTITPASLPADVLDSVIANAVENDTITWSRRFMIYSVVVGGATQTINNNTIYIEKYFKTGINAMGMEINFAPVAIPVPGVGAASTTYSYEFRVDSNTVINTSTAINKSVMYSLSSPICSIPPLGTKIDASYQLDYKYLLSNNGSPMVYDGGLSNSGVFNFSYQISVSRQLNLRVVTTPDALDFGQIPNSAPSERDIKISIKGAPENSSMRVSYQLSNTPSWATISIMDGVTDVTSASETVNAGNDIDRTVKIQPVIGSNGDIDARLTINVALN